MRNLLTKFIDFVKKLGQKIQTKMNKIGYLLVPLTWIRWDYQKHAVFGVWFGSVGFMLMKEFSNSDILSMILAVLLSWVAGTIKEFTDDKFDWMDVLWTVIGGLIGSVIFLILLK